MSAKLWVDKYRPNTIDQLSYHHDLGRLLKKLGESGDIPHLLFYGPSGAGKKTRVLALLNTIFGAGVSKVKCEIRNFKAGTTSAEITVLQSNFHIDMTPSDVGFRDKVVVQQIIKEIGSSKNPDGRTFKVIVLNQADYLSDEAQAALRRTLEKYTVTTRLILVANSLCRIIAPIRSRCLGIRIPAPTNSEIKEVLNKIAASENLTIPASLEQRILQNCNRNLRRAIMIMQSVYIQHNKLPPEAPVPIPEWEKYLKEITHNIIEDQSPKCLKIVRGKLYEVLASCIPATTIFITLTKELLLRTDPVMKQWILCEAGKYELTMKSGSKPIIHLEAFIAKFMSGFKDHTNHLALVN
jgi:replication factor C subunit 3/5